MIAKLFYPKELKEIIRLLKSEDNLNHQALKSINRHIYILLLISIALITYFSDHLIIIGIICLIFPLLIFYEARNVYQKLMQPYLNDNKLHGVISDIKFYAGAIGAREYYINIPSENKTYTTPIFVDRRKKSKKPKINEAVLIYPSIKNPTHAMLDHNFYNKQFQLRKSKLKQTVPSGITRDT